MGVFEKWYSAYKAGATQEELYNIVCPKGSEARTHNDWLDEQSNKCKPKKLSIKQSKEIISGCAEDKHS